MDRLPQELVDRISSYLDLDELKNTLTVSRKFQVAAEQCSGAFAGFHLNLDDTTADKFVERFSNRRFRYLRDVDVRTHLPDPSAEGQDDDGGYLPCRESAEELRKLDEHFTGQINFLFQTLKTLEDQACEKYGPGKIRLTIGTPVMKIDRAILCHHRAFVSWRIHLLNPERLPKLTSIRSVRIVNGASYNPTDDPTESLRKLDLRVLLDLSSRLPNLESLACEIGGDEWPTPCIDEVAKHLTHVYQGPRRDSRLDFSKALAAVSLPSLREFQLNFIQPLWHIDLIDQRDAMPNLVSPSAYDPFSNSLRMLSYKLRRMCLFAVVDETLFWPSDDTTPHWPYLETINIRFHMTTPSGTWYFKGLEGEGRIDGYELSENSYPPLEKTTEDAFWDDREDEICRDATASAQFRVMPNDETLLPFLAAIAKATAHMPSLHELALWCPLHFSAYDMGDIYEEYDITELITAGSKDMAWGIAYSKPGVEAFSDMPGENYSAARQLWWKVGKWRPSAELSEMFRRIGRQQHGEELIEYWGDEEGRDGLVEREVFEYYEWRTFPEFALELLY